MHPLFQKADPLSREVISAASEVHRLKGTDKGKRRKQRFAQRIVSASTQKDFKGGRALSRHAVPRRPGCRQPPTRTIPRRPEGERPRQIASSRHRLAGLLAPTPAHEL